MVPLAPARIARVPPETPDSLATSPSVSLSEGPVAAHPKAPTITASTPSVVRALMFLSPGRGSASGEPRHEARLFNELRGAGACLGDQAGERGGSFFIQASGGRGRRAAPLPAVVAA